MNAIMKNKASSSTSTRCKTTKSKKRSIANIREFLSRFEPLFYVFAFTNMKDFH